MDDTAEDPVKGNIIIHPAHKAVFLDGTTRRNEKFK